LFFFFDFFSFIYIIVYVGALFVLFLFVVKLSSQVNGPIAYFYYEFVYFIIALLVSFFLSIFVLFFDLDFYFFDLFEYFFWFDWSNVGYGFLVTLGQVLYSEFFLVMILNIILLFIGAVFPIFYLLGDYNVFRRNQDVFEQVSRSNRLLFFRVK
jgi:NADH:ubiquinone oxidoreductase subunit 6 (subunit J)